MTHYIRNKSLKSALFLSLLAISSAAFAQTYRISGRVINDKNKPVKGASVYLDNTIDGATADSNGVFSFTTTEKGNQTIVASEVTHETGGLPIVINGDVSNVEIRLKSNKTRDLDAVVITAGSFDASNDKTKTVLKPLDIVTTAGAGADVVKAMSMLPGTQQTGADNGMFVRGGDASESAIIVDEMIVQNAFFAGPPGVATRSRFGAFSYQGVAFSSGGYSARYGQALSSVLELNTNDLPEKSNINLGVNMAGVYANGVKKWKNSALDVGGSYNNTAPFFKLATTNMNFNKPPEGGAGNIRYTWKPNKNGIFKASANINYTASGIDVPNAFSVDTSRSNFISYLPDTIQFKTKDTYFYSSASYKQNFRSKYMLYTAASYSLDKGQNSFGPIPMPADEHRAQIRVEGKDYFNARMNLLVGTDVQNFGITRSISYPDSTGGTSEFKQEFTETIIGAYTELEWTPYYWLAVKPGLRYEHSTILKQDKVAPRLSMAIKTGTYSQVSLAGGVFYQDPGYNYLQAGLKPMPGMQEAMHYIANWQWGRNDRLLRVEGYYKKYNDLVLEHPLSFDANPYRFINNTTYIDNGGDGYAQGLELFYRDKKSIKNVDYWVSYSFIDTKRKYGNFKELATPSFIADHNFNLVAKYYVDKWHTNFSATYSYASGRPYYNPNAGIDFMSQRTPDFHNVALTVAYLRSFGKWFTVFYISLDNITNQKNVFGYRYAYNNTNATYTQTPVLPALYRSIFFGVNMSLTQFKKDEL